MSSSNSNLAGGQHGGNMSWLHEKYPAATRPLIDLSTCINPYGYELPTAAPDWNHSLSDIADMQSVCAAAAMYYGVESEHVALAAGMQPVMAALAALRLQRYGQAKVSIAAPTYSEHGRVWGNLGHVMDNNSPDVVIICNPNNPDGRVLSREELRSMAKQLEARDGWLILDESFADLQPEVSFLDELKHYNNVIILRSCGKFFGLAGMRVSCALAAEHFIHWLRVMLGPWPITTVACKQLPMVFQDKGWAVSMERKLHQEAVTWRNALSRYFTVIGYTALFTLVETDRAGDWFDYLASQGILIRQFDYNRRWLRFGLPNAEYIQRISQTLANGASK